MNSDFEPGLQNTNSLHLAKLMESLLDFDNEMIVQVISGQYPSKFESPSYKNLGTQLL